MSLIGERLPATLLLTLTAFVVSLTLGVALGAWSSARAGTWLDSRSARCRCCSTPRRYSGWR